MLQVDLTPEEIAGYLGQASQRCATNRPEIPYPSQSRKLTLRDISLIGRTRQTLDEDRLMAFAKEPAPTAISDVCCHGDKSFT